MKGYPNSYFYEPSLPYHKGKKVGDWARKMHLASSGDFIVGKDFIATFKSGADSYYFMNKLIVWDKSCEKYHELKRHCEEYEFTKFTTKTKVELYRDIGISSEAKEPNN